jgi:hypothetical protein
MTCHESSNGPFHHHQGFKMNEQELRTTLSAKKTSNAVETDKSSGPPLTFFDLWVGDRFLAFDAIWTKLDIEYARHHTDVSLRLEARGYGYIGDSVCTFENNVPVQFLLPTIGVLSPAINNMVNNGLSRFYVASRPSILERPAMWRALRASGHNIVSTWIDEPRVEGVFDFRELWHRIEAEIRSADELVLYLQPTDFPLKGALVEVGMALAMGKPVTVVAPDVPINPHDFSPLGSWAAHPNVRLCDCLTTALANRSVRSADKQTS